MIPLLDANFYFEVLQKLGGSHLRGFTLHVPLMILYHAVSSKLFGLKSGSESDFHPSHNFILKVFKKSLIQYSTFARSIDPSLEKKTH